MAVVPRRAMHTTTAPPLEAFSRTVELCNFGIGLVAGFLLVTCAYFSNTKFDAIHIARLNLGMSGQDATLSMDGARARCWTRTVRTTEATPPRRKVGNKPFDYYCHAPAMAMARAAAAACRALPMHFGEKVRANCILT
ncbi:uncharacterized protein [Triticum aestivum]|uniref:uncharacterized protein n=1 Tax=Triticum aestivum TaxID=4565 RepID=UPI001D02056B|nr:uncharacterized protein LOC123114169 [Triticum aestivum]